MNSRNWLNLGLLIVFCLLAALALWDEPDQKGEQAPRLSGIDPGKLSRFSIERPDSTNIEFQKDDKGWRVIRPFTATADEKRVLALLTVLTAPAFTVFAVEPDKLTQYKLKPPLASLVADGQRFDFGDTDPLNKRRYVLHAGRIHLLSDNQFPLLLTAPYVMTSTRLLPSASAPVEIQLATHTLRRDHENTWHIEPAINGVEHDALAKLAEDWRLGRALRVSAPDQSKPDWWISVKLQDGSQYRFGVITRDPELLLVREDQALGYHFALEQGRVLINAPHPPKPDLP